MISTPFTASSIGVATERATTSALAPGYDAVTCTVGGAISGNCVIGSVKSDMMPSKTRRIDITVERTGLSMNFRNIVCELRNPENFQVTVKQNVSRPYAYSDAALNKLSVGMLFGLMI